MDWKWILIGFTLLGLSAFAQAAYNPYVNYGYGRPYYSQFHALPGIDRVGQVYYGSGAQSYSYSNGWESYSEVAVKNRGYYGYSPSYYYYRSPASFAYPTVTAYVAPVRTVAFGSSFVYYN